jgi:type I restriction enzyme M protein
MQPATPRLPRLSTDPLGRYYTIDSASRLLIAQLQDKKPARILDLGAGAGSLTLAARREWRYAQIITVDIDTASSQRLYQLDALSELGNHTHFNYDALKFDLPQILGGKDSVADIAVCNPPFLKPIWRKEYASILEEAGLSGCYATMKDATAEVLFLAQNLRLIRDKGSLGIIVPDGIVSGKKHENLRRELIRSHGIKSVIKLPRTAFTGTDAQAYIITLIKHGKADDRIELRRLDAAGQWDKSIFIDNKTAACSFDFSFNSISMPPNCGFRKLSSLVVSLRRGTIISSDREKASPHAFHVTDFPVDNAIFSIPKRFRSDTPTENSGGVFAKKGDILLARIGRNLESKICQVRDGFMQVTDCVYVIRPSEEHRHKIFEALRSDFGRMWLTKVAHGVSARHLPKCDLLDFPVTL